MRSLASRRLGRTGLLLTELGFGGAPLGNLFTPVLEAAARRAVTVAVETGVGYFDTAPLYGHGLSESRLGEALRDAPREAFVLSTKVGRRLEPCDPRTVDGGAYVDLPPFRPVFDYSYDGVLRSVATSLARRGTFSVAAISTNRTRPFSEWTKPPSASAYSASMSGQCSLTR